MQVAVVLEPISGNGYRATIYEPFRVSAEGATQDEAVRNVRCQFEDRARQGVEIVMLNVPLPKRVLPAQPIWPDDETTRNWLEGIAEYRRKRNAEPDPWDAATEPPP